MVKPTVKPMLKASIKPVWLMTMIFTTGFGWLFLGDGIGGTPSAQAQINVGGTSAPGTVNNDKSLSQQSLQEMQQNISTAGSGSMQMIRFGSQVSFPPLEGVQRILNWQVQSGANNAVTQDQQLSQAFHQFKQLQATQQSNNLSGNSVVSSQSRNGDLLPALQILKKSSGTPANQ